MKTTTSSQEYRCSCGKLLFKGDVVKGCVEIKCKRCGMMRVITGTGLLLLFEILEVQSFYL